MSVIDDILSEKRRRSNESDKLLNGVYLEPELDAILNGLAKKGGKGVKTEIANEAFRKLFVEKGLIRAKPPNKD